MKNNNLQIFKHLMIINGLSFMLYFMYNIVEYIYPDDKENDLIEKK